MGFEEALPMQADTTTKCLVVTARCMPPTPTQGNHIYTSGATGTNAAVIKGALRANCPDKLTVILPQSLKRQPSESQDLLIQVGGRGAGGGGRQSQGIGRQSNAEERRAPGRSDPSPFDLT